MSRTAEFAATLITQHFTGSTSYILKTETRYYTNNRGFRLIQTVGLRTLARAIRPVRALPDEGQCKAYRP